MEYQEFSHNQERPDLSPNVFAYHLAGLTGHHHHAAHRALLATNPTLILTDAGPVLELDDLQAAVAALGHELLRGLGHSAVGPAKG